MDSPDYCHATIASLLKTSPLLRDIAAQKYAHTAFRGNCVSFVAAALHTQLCHRGKIIGFVNDTEYTYHIAYQYDPCMIDGNGIICGRLPQITREYAHRWVFNSNLFLDGSVDHLREPFHEQYGVAMRDTPLSMIRKFINPYTFELTAVAVLHTTDPITSPDDFLCQFTPME